MANIVKVQPVKAMDISRDSLTDFIYTEIGNLFLVLGQKSDEYQMQILLEVIPKDIQFRFKTLELPEIKKAFEDGVRGVYGEYFGVNVVTLNKWLKSYMDSGEHSKYIETKVKTLAPMLTEKTEPTQSEIDNIMRLGIIRCFNDYKNTGIVIDYGSPKYDWLFTKGILLPTDEQIEYYLSQARSELEQQARDKKESINRIDRMEAKREMISLLNMGDDNSKIQYIAKNMAMADFFETIIEEEKSIEEIIK